MDARARSTGVRVNPPSATPAPGGGRRIPKWGWIVLIVAIGVVVGTVLQNSKTKADPGSKLVCEDVQQNTLFGSGNPSGAEIRQRIQSLHLEASSATPAVRLALDKAIVDTNDPSGALITDAADLEDACTAAGYPK